MNRRRFLKRALWAGAGLSAGLYPFLEAKWCHIRRVDVELSHLAPGFVGATVALISDVHHGPFVPISFVEHVVELTNGARPDLVLLAGDYVHRDKRYIAPCIAALSRLSAPLGVYAVLGNHDHWESASATRHQLERHGIVDLTNTGTWLSRRGGRLRLGGVGDYWEDVQDLDAALGDATHRDAALLLNHNPDYVEEIEDPRVGLVLSGHTHGGQVDLPFAGPPLLPSQYGQRFAHGLVHTEVTRVFVSRGVGTITPPVRLNCRPEVILLRLRAAS